MSWFGNLSKSDEIAREGPRIVSAYGGGRSFHQWRIKWTFGGSYKFISLYFKPCFYHGPPRTCYVEFDLDSAKRSRDCLREMIESLEKRDEYVVLSSQTVASAPSAARSNYMFGSVLKSGPEIRSGWATSAIRWRIKQTRDGTKKFVSVQIKPSHYYGLKGRAHYFLSLNLASARQSLNNLEEIIQELEREDYRLSK